MKIFVTGATGWVGSALVPELLRHGHAVVGLARSEESLAKLRAVGAEARKGDLDDVEVMAAGARECDAVVHLAFRHDLFSDMGQALAIDARAIRAMGDAMEGTGKALVGTSGFALGIPVALVTEDDHASDRGRGASENLLLGYADRGVRAMVVRLGASVHGEGDHGFVAYLTGMARKNGFAAYVGDGANRWPAVPLADAARLYRMVLEKGRAGSLYHGVEEEGVSMRSIAETIGAGLKLPARGVSQDEAKEKLGWMAFFAGTDMPASSAKTQAELGWTPAGPGLLEDVREHYLG